MNSCIEHNQKGSKLGYGSTHRVVNGIRTPLGLHRAVFYDVHGYLPKVVMHSCDNPRCVNPGHLLPGTHKENTADMVAKGRGVTKQIKQRKLSTEAVLDIRNTDESIRQMAKKYDVTPTVVWGIRSGATYREVH